MLWIILLAIVAIFFFRYVNSTSSKNQDSLNQEEIEAASLLKTVFNGYYMEDPLIIETKLEKLAMGLYYLAFRRTNKKVFRLEEALDPLFIVQGDPKGIHYIGIYQAIKEGLETTCKNPTIIRSNITQSDCEATVLLLLKETANRISKI